MSKFKANAENKFDVGEIMGFVFERAEKIVGKGENADYCHFLLFLQCFLAHLSTTCSMGAFRVVQCPLSVVCHQQFL